MPIFYLFLLLRKKDDWNLGKNYYNPDCKLQLRLVKNIFAETLFCIAIDKWISSNKAGTLWDLLKKKVQTEKYIKT